MIPHPDWIALDAGRLESLLQNNPALPPHFHVIFTAVRDYGLRLAFLQHGSEDSDLEALQQASPFIAMVLDDSGASLGPAAFDQQVLKNLTTLAHCAAVLACAPITAVYESLCRTAGAMRQNLLIVETLPAHEMTWAAYLRCEKPQLPLVVGSVNPDRVRRAGL
ncbi:MAG: hypothetical protein ACK53X_06840 [Holosporales bacterium]